MDEGEETGDESDFEDIDTGETDPIWQTGLAQTFVYNIISTGVLFTTALYLGQTVCSSGHQLCHRAIILYNQTRHLMTGPANWDLCRNVLHSDIFLEY